MAEAASRLGAPSPVKWPLIVDDSRTYSADQVKVSVTAGGQTIEFENVKHVELETEPTTKYNAGDDRALAAAYAFAERRKVEEAAARLDGSYVERVSAVPKGWDTDWDQPNPNRTPRLDGRRWKK